jgi:hypothetical protein
VLPAGEVAFSMQRIQWPLLQFEKTLLGTLCMTTSLTRLRMSLLDTRSILSSQYI